MSMPAADHRPTAASSAESDRAGWFTILKRSFKQLKRDDITDRAAALTYFGVLAIFPAMLVLVSILGLIGPDTADRLLANVRSVAPGGVTTFLSGVIDQVQGKAGAASAAAIVGVLVALWSASGYIAASMRAANAVYGVGEGRPFWKTIPVRLLTTIVVVVLLVACAVIVVVTGPIADQIGSVLGLGDVLQQVWAIAKWPVLVIIVALLFSLLYAATPNVKYGRFRLLTRGGLLAVITWMIASGLFGVYVSFSGSYNKTYGPLATVIVFLVWLWISNIAILLGLEFDSETERERVIRSGADPDLEPYVRVRDTRKLEDKDRERVQAAAAALPARRFGDDPDDADASTQAPVSVGDGAAGGDDVPGEPGPAGVPPTGTGQRAGTEHSEHRPLRWSDDPEDPDGATRA